MKNKSEETNEGELSTSDYARIPINENPLPAHTCILQLIRWRHEGQEFKASLSYTAASIKTSLWEEQKLRHKVGTTSTSGLSSSLKFLGESLEVWLSPQGTVFLILGAPA